MSGTGTHVRSAELGRKPMLAMVTLSAAIAAFPIWLIYFKGKVAAPDCVRALPAANASFNSLSALCLILGYINIRRGNRVTHMRFMLSATVFSTLFLVSYVTYHFFHGDTVFPGHGWIRPVYFFILISHIGLSRCRSFWQRSGTAFEASSSSTGALLDGRFQFGCTSR